MTKLSFPLHPFKQTTCATWALAYDWPISFGFFCFFALRTAVVLPYYNDHVSLLERLLFNKNYSAKVCYSNKSHQSARMKM